MTGPGEREATLTAGALYEQQIVNARILEVGVERRRAIAIFEGFRHTQLSFPGKSFLLVEGVPLVRGLDFVAQTSAHPGGIGRRVVVRGDAPGDSREVPTLVTRVLVRSRVRCPCCGSLRRDCTARVFFYPPAYTPTFVSRSILRTRFASFSRVVFISCASPENGV